MPSDLNLKKSWNPKLLKNRTKVWRKEQELLRQHRKNQAHDQRISEIKDKSELISLTNAHSRDTTSWMYASHNESTGSASDDFMLGRKKLRLEPKQVKEVSRFDKVMNTEKEEEDDAKKTKVDKEDPMYMFNIEEQKRKRHHHHHHHHHHDQNERDISPGRSRPNYRERK